MEIKPSDPMPEEDLAKLRVYAKQVLNIERDIVSIKHKLHIKINRTPKLQMLFDMIREISEASRGTYDGELLGNHESD